MEALQEEECCKEGDEVWVEVVSAPSYKVSRSRKDEKVRKPDLNMASASIVSVKKYHDLSYRCYSAICISGNADKRVRERTSISIGLSVPKKTRLTTSPKLNATNSPKFART